MECRQLRSVSQYFERYQHNLTSQQMVLSQLRLMKLEQFLVKLCTTHLVCSQKKELFERSNQLDHPLFTKTE